MRLNLFLPFRDASKGWHASARRSMPPSLLRRVLGTIGPSWLSSPVRRVVQAAALGGFLVLFFYVCWPGARPYAESMQAKEIVEAETFLALDPLVSISAAIAARAWVWSLMWMGAILLICLFIPRGFCGYLCPLGTSIDLFDWAIGKRLRGRGRGDGRRGKGSPGVRPRRWWVHLKYYVLAGTLVAAAFGVLVTGFVAAIPVLTRGMAFALGPLQLGLLRGWHLVRPPDIAQIVSIVLLAAVMALGLFGRRFWCRYVCPSGAVFSIANLLRLTGRKVASSCIQCGRCVESCPFDAIKTDFHTRSGDCTFCQTCGGVCPAGAIEFVDRWHKADLRPACDRPSAEIPLSRRGFLAGTAGGLAAALGIGRVFGAGLNESAAALPIRPPGSIPEEKFLAACVRCGSCLKACPTNVLRPLGLARGLQGLWTPQAAANWAGCDPNCNLCGQVCPTGAIRPLPLPEKRAARMGLAAVNEKTCLPHAGRGDCGMCVQACKSAGYGAIEYIRLHVEMSEDGTPLEDTGFLAPEVRADKCVGCGLCQARCYQINVLDRRLLKDAAIHVTAGPGREDRIMRGSYRALREAERRRRKQRREKLLDQSAGEDSYITDFP